MGAFASGTTSIHIREASTNGSAKGSSDISPDSQPRLLQGSTALALDASERSQPSRTEWFPSGRIVSEGPATGYGHRTPTNNIAIPTHPQAEMHVAGCQLEEPSLCSAPVAPAPLQAAHPVRVDQMPECGARFRAPRMCRRNERGRSTPREHRALQGQGTMDLACVPEGWKNAEACDDPRRCGAPPQHPARRDEDPRSVDHELHRDAQPPLITGPQRAQLGDQIHDQLDQTRVPHLRIHITQREGGTLSNGTCTSNPDHVQTQLQSGAEPTAPSSQRLPTSSWVVATTIATRRCDTSPCSIPRTSGTQLYIKHILDAIAESSTTTPLDRDLSDDYKTARAHIDQIMRDKRNTKSRIGYECTPPVPGYLASTFDLAFKSPDIIPGTHIPLKPAAPPLNQERLEELGWRERHFLDGRLLLLIDWDKLRTIPSSNTPHIKTYYHDLIRTGRFEPVARRNDDSVAAYMYGKPVTKSDGVTARWVADPPTNKGMLPHTDVSVKFPRPEWIALMLHSIKVLWRLMPTRSTSNFTTIPRFARCSDIGSADRSCRLSR